MKKTLSTLLFLIPFFCFAQTKKPIEGFFGIKFGMDSAAVKAAILAKGGVNVGTPKPNSVRFDVPKFEMWENVTLVVGFTGNKAYNIMIGIVEKDENKTIQDYNKLVNETNSIFGIGKQESEAPSSETVWIDKDKNNISVSTLGTKIIAVSYVNANLEAAGAKNH